MRIRIPTHCQYPYPASETSILIRVKVYRSSQSEEWETHTGMLQFYLYIFIQHVANIDHNSAPNTGQNRYRNLSYTKAVLSGQYDPQYIMKYYDQILVRKHQKTRIDIETCHIPKPSSAVNITLNILFKRYMYRLFCKQHPQ